MIKAIILGESYNIPTTWGDITFSQYQSLGAGKDEEELFSIFTGIPIDLVNRIEKSEIDKLSIFFGFLKYKLIADEYEAPDHLVINGKNIPLVIDIKEKTFGQKIWFQELMKGKDDLTSIIPDIIALYAQPYIDDTPFNINRVEQIKVLLQEQFFVSLYSTAFNYIKQFQKIIEIESETLRVPPDSAKIEAGVSMFEKFGVMNTIKALANNDITKFEEVTTIEYNTVYNWMLMNKTQNIFNENYRKILERNAKRK
jgi:hypothetical protein